MPERPHPAAEPASDEHLDLAVNLIRSGDLKAALHHVRRAADMSHPDAPSLYAIGEMLYKLGDFQRSADLFERALEQSLTSRHAANALRYLCALRSKAGDAHGARQAIQAAARLSPYRMPNRFDPEKPTLLRIREVDHSHYAIRRSKRSGLRGRRLKGGHFSPKALIVKSDFNVILANVTAGLLPPSDNLPPVDVIVNSVACPDLCGDSLVHVERFLSAFPDVEVINAPAHVLQTTREIGAERLGALPGVRFPQTRCVANDAPLSDVVARIEALGMGYPLILRRPGTQTGKTVGKVDNRDALIAYLAQANDSPELLVIEFIDCRDTAGFYHKTRCFFIDGQFYPVANLTNDRWEIHSGDRYRVMDRVPGTQAEERRYLEDPEGYLGAQVMESLRAVSRVVDLDFFGIDFTVSKDGQLVIFEANAAMRHNFDHARRFPYTRPHLERISRAFNDMLHARVGTTRQRRRT